MRRGLVRATLGIVPFVVAMLVGCSSTAHHVENDAAPSAAAARASSTTTTKPLTGPAAVKTYFDDIGSGDPVLLLEAAALTAGGSRARVYTTNLFWLALGDAPDLETATPNRGGFTLCRSGTNLSGNPQCFDYTGILMTADGRIATFMINRVPLAAMVREPGSPVTAGALTATVISSYRRSDGTLFVVVAVRNNSSDEQYVIGQSYTDPHGHQLDAFLATTGYAIDPGATKNIGYGVPNADFGGNLLLLSGDLQHALTMSLPVG